MEAVSPFPFAQKIAQPFVPGTSMAIAASAMAGSLRESFWAIPAVAIAGVGVQRVAGFTLVIFLRAGSLLGLVYRLVVPTWAGTHHSVRLGARTRSIAS